MVKDRVAMVILPKAGLLWPWGWPALGYPCGGGWAGLGSDITTPHKLTYARLKNTIMHTNNMKYPPQSKDVR